MATEAAEITEEMLTLPNEGKINVVHPPLTVEEKKKGEDRFHYRNRKRKERGEGAPPTKKQIKAEEKKAQWLTEAPLSRYTQLPTKHGETILQGIELFLKTRITDKWLLFESEKVKRKTPQNSGDSIDWLFFSSLSNDEKFKGKDLQELISKQRDSSLIESTRVSSYVTIGVENLNTYLVQHGGYIHCILSGQSNLRENVVCREANKDVPIFVIPGLTEVLMGFTELKAENFCNCIAFKKVKDSPFNDLVKLIADNIPDEISPSVLVQTADRSLQLPWKESIDRCDLENERNSQSYNVVSFEESRQFDLSSNSNFTEGLPLFSAEIQRIILAKLDAAFEYTIPRFLVTGKRNTLKTRNPNLPEDEIEKQLYVDTLCNEICSGLDIIDILFSNFAKSKNSFIVPSNLGQMMYKHVEKGGTFHFILYCNSAREYINTNGEFQAFVDNIPLFEIKGLSSIFDKYYTRLPGNTAMLTFKKADDNPLEDLIKFVEGKISKAQSFAEDCF